MKTWVIFFSFFLIFSLTAVEPQISTKKMKAIFHSIPPKSIIQNLAFYQLYPHTSEGKRALQRATSLLQIPYSEESWQNSLELPEKIAEAITSLVSPTADSLPSLNIDENQIAKIEILGRQLKNRKLMGNQAKSTSEVLQLPSAEIDLSRGLLLSQFENSEEAWKKIRRYEVALDLMALHVQANLSEGFTPEEAVYELNRFIFEELQFRFPPHSVYAKDVDLYSFLPSVLESRRGVCLGVSILYLCLGQRLGIPLEIITPPGHIYVRYNDGKKCINIETTARGIHLDSEEYLGINTKTLEKRNIKETIGMAHFNKAGGLFMKGKYQEALESYEISLLYCPGDRLTREWMGYCHFVLGNKSKAFSLLENLPSDPCSITDEILLRDILEGSAQPEDLGSVFMEVNETRESLLEKKEGVLAALQRSPKFRGGWFHFAVVQLQLNREKEALEALKKYHELDPNNPSVEYYLSVLYGKRYHFPKCWEHLHNAERITQAKDHNPKILKELRKELALIYPCN